MKCKRCGEELKFGPAHECPAHTEVSVSAEVPGYGAWIAVGTRSPDKGQLVLAVDCNGDMAVVQQYNDIFFAVAFGYDAYEDNGGWDRSADRIAEKITHWMPLPVAP